MTDLDRALLDLAQKLEQARLQVENRQIADKDAELINAISDGTATPADVDRLAHLLFGQVRAQLLRAGAWRQRERLEGEPLGFVPTNAMAVAVEISSYGPEERLPPGLEDKLTSPAHPPRKASGRYVNHAWEHLCFKWWVESVVVSKASGSTDCIEIRTIIEQWPDAGPPPPEALLYADERALRLAAPLPRGPGQNPYRIVSHDAVPWA